ncbi:hypothetical protein CN13_03490 [Petrotoga sp. HKA.pet.4.5]|nr:hypothetical protein BZ25_08595 [Petrotoga sp. Shatin.DS.tank11.9.2.9.3]RLL89974.1 hypothetical protein CN13_03490 [Petrotoga sp. HKA.pet.4.5]
MIQLNLKHLSHLYLTDVEQGVGVYVKDNYAYAANYLNGLVIVDVSNPENPILAADMPSFTFIVISGN